MCAVLVSFFIFILNMSGLGSFNFEITPGNILDQSLLCPIR